MSRVVTSLCAMPSFATFGTPTYYAGVSGGITVSDIIVWGFGHLTGKTVSAFIGGLDCGDYTVAADGSITVPLLSDTDGLLTEAYLTALDGDYGEIGATIAIGSSFDDGDSVATTIEVPVVVGLPYTTRGRVLRPATQEDLRSPQGPGHAKTRSVFQAAYLFHNTVGCSVGTEFDQLFPARLTDARGADLAKNILYSGICHQAINDYSSFEGALAWEQTRPYPTTVCAITGFIETEDR